MMSSLSFVIAERLTPGLRRLWFAPDVQRFQGRCNER